MEEGVIREEVNLRATALPEFWGDEYPDSVYLWHGCKHERPLNEVENNPVPTYPDLFGSRPELEQAHQVCKGFYYKMLSLLGQRLNWIHGLECSESFWQVCFGYWLYRHIAITYDKYATLSHFNLEKVSITLLDERDFYVPFDHYDYLSCFVRDFGVQQLVTQYLSISSRRAWRRIRRSFQAPKIDYCNMPGGGDGAKNEKVALLGVYLSESVYQQLYSASGGKIGNIALPATPSSQHLINAEARRMLSDAPDDGSFESYFLRTLYYCMPRSYLEEFRVYYDIYRTDIEASRFEFLVAEAWISHIQSAIYAAIAKESGRYLVVLEHGSGSGFFKNSLSFIDRESANIYLSVGWGKKSEVFIPGGFASRELMPYQYRPDKTRLLFLGHTRCPYWLELFEAATAGKGFLAELRRASDFIRLLPAPLREQLTFRPRDPDLFYWDTDRTLELRTRGLQVDRGSDFAESVRRSRLVIIDHISTGIAELLMIGVPFILLYDVASVGFERDFELAFEELARCGVLHKDAASASTHLAAVYDDVQGWWRSAPVEAAVDRLRGLSLGAPSQLIGYLLSLLSSNRQVLHNDSAFLDLLR